MILPSEISNVTNRVDELLAQASGKPNRIDRDKAKAEALYISCKLLTKLAKDDIYFEYEKAVSKGNVEAFKINKINSSFQLVSMELGHFHGFLDQEVTLMQAVGYDPKLTNMLSEHIEHRIDHLRAHPSTGNELKRAVIRLQRYICNQSELMTKALQSEQKRKYFLLGLMGIGTISANILAVEVFSPVGIGASAAIGGALVTDSVKDFISEVWRN